MKKLIYFTLLLAFVSMTSCNNPTANQTPTIALAIDSIGIEKTDTLKFKKSPLLEDYLDTISVGDTVSFGCALNAYENNLVSFEIIETVDSVGEIIFPANLLSSSSLLSTNDFENKKLKFIAETNSFVFYFKYVALHPSTTAKLTFLLTSDAKFDDEADGKNNSSLTIITPIKY